MKRIVVFHRVVEKEIGKLPIETAQELADLLRQVRDGVSLSMPVSRPMPSVAHGAHELRLTDRAGEIRVLYYVKIENSVLVFHLIRKKTQKTAKADIETAQIRLGAMLEAIRKEIKK